VFVITSSSLACRVRHCVLPVMAAFCLSSCGSDSPSQPAELASVHVTLTSSTLQVGQTLTAKAVGLDRDGAEVNLSSVAWSSENPAVATIGTAGQITAVSPGQAVITASSGSKSGQATLTVIQVPVSTVSVTPVSPAVLIIGIAEQFTAATLDAQRTPLVGRQVSWSTSDASLATVSASGVVTGLSSGNVSITATSEGKHATVEAVVVFIPVASVEVTPPSATIGVGRTQQLTARTLTNTGAALPGKPVAWSSSDESKATVSSSGLVTAIAAGSVTIAATSEGRAGSALITVVP
jgi:trimeric autotransporter adhesin